MCLKLLFPDQTAPLAVVGVSPPVCPPLCCHRLHPVLLCYCYSSGDQGLDEALNVLARGLEQNKASSELWLEYLRLYARHSAATDYTNLCQTALQYAPSFQIHWLVS